MRQPVETVGTAVAEEAKIRVLLVSFVPAHPLTGMGKWASRMAQALVEQGCETRVWSADDFPLVQRTGRLAVVLFPVVLALRLSRARRSFDAVVIHEPGGFWYGLLRHMFPALPPLIVMCHNVESKHYRELLSAASRGFATIKLATRIKTPIFRLWQSDGAIRMADHVLCLSTLDHDYLVNRLGCDRHRVSRLVNGVAPENFIHRRDRPPGRRVLFVGGWLDVKGRRLLPAIWSMVRARFPDACLTMIGAGWSRDVVLTDFQPHDRESVVIVHKALSEPEMTAQWASHDLFLMPSLSEGCPLALLEAMAAALPIVAARVGGIPDIMTHGRTGLLFEPMDVAAAAARVCDLLADPDSAIRLGRAAQTEAQALTWAAAALRMKRAVEAAVKHGHGHGGAREASASGQLSTHR